MMQATPIPVTPSEPVAKDESPAEVSSDLASPAPEIKEGPKSTTSPSPLLQELSSVDRLMITKRLKVKGVLFFRGKKNRFFVRTPDRELLYTVEEENSWWVGYLCYGLRPLQLKVTNHMGEEVLRIERPYAMTTRVLPCKLQHLDVFSPTDQLLGTVEQQYSHIKPVYKVLNKEGEELFIINGPLVTVSVFRDVKFEIRRCTDGRNVGETCKRWQGLMHALFYSPVTDRQDYPIDPPEITFGVAFDKSLTEDEKALLLAATLLMEYMYYDV